MFEREVQLLLGMTPAEVMRLMMSILDLLESLVLNHNWMSNTQLATLAEAQGAELFRSNGVVANHGGALQQALANLENEEGQITQQLLQIQRANRSVGNAVFDVLRPLMDLSRETRRVGSNVLAEAAQLARTVPNRLAGIKFEAGERGRATSIVQQIARQAPELRQRGIDPTLISNATDAERALIAEAEALPAEEREALVRMTPVVVLMRQMIAAQLRAAAGAARAALSRFLGPLETMLDFLARTLGSRLTSFIIVPRSVLKEMLRSAGVSSSADDA
ncbi:MAG: hypothetical protein AB1586_10275 [Pseudomonadota bacterium]